MLTEETRRTHRAIVAAKVEAFRTEWAGRILSSRTETRSTWLDGGDYYDVLRAHVWTGAEVEEKYVACEEDAGHFHFVGRDLLTLTPDATPDVIAAAKAWEAREQAYADRCYAGREQRDGKRLRSGDLVVVVTGRKVEAGTVHVVTWCGDSEYGTRVRLSPIDERGSAVVRGRDGGGDTYTSAANVRVLMDAHEVRDDWRAPVSETAARRYRVGALAWSYAQTDGAHSTAAELGARTDYDLDALRALDARERWARYADRLASDDLAREVAAAFVGACPMLDATTPHTLDALLDALDGDRPAVENDLAITQGDRAAILRALVTGRLTTVYVPPVKARRTRARKAA